MRVRRCRWKFCKLVKDVHCRNGRICKFSHVLTLMIGAHSGIEFLEPSQTYFHLRLFRESGRAQEPRKWEKIDFGTGKEVTSLSWDTNCYEFLCSFKHFKFFLKIDFFVREK